MFLPVSAARNADIISPKHRAQRTKKRGLAQGKTSVSCQLVRNVRNESHLTSTLDCYRKFSLVTGANTCHTAGQNFAAFRKILLELSNVLVIDVFGLFYAEVANLSASGLSHRLFEFFIFHCYSPC
jgi:hypothetical protein